MAFKTANKSSTHFKVVNVQRGALSTKKEPPRAEKLRNYEIGPVH